MHNVDGPMVVAAMSGGVDSAVAAALQVEAGVRVVGMTLRLYDASGTSESSGGRCCGPRDVEDARAVCAYLGIPYYVIDKSTQFQHDVIDDFVDAYLAGETPNPCVRCNQHVKFGPLLTRARQLGAEAMITGHYARIDHDHKPFPSLHRAVDDSKDQSYFLFAMPPEALPLVRFPLGGLTKTEVRDHARRLGLPNADKAESQEICFVPDGNYAGFVAQSALRRGKAAPAAGNIVDESGRILGTHEGSHLFTVGQHRGLGNLHTTGGQTRRLVVIDVDAAAAKVVVGERAAAEKQVVTVRGLRWLGPAPDAKVLQAAVQVRHRGAAIPSEITWDGDAARMVFESPALAARGQSAVIYDGDRVLGGGWIDSFGNVDAQS